MSFEFKSLAGVDATIVGHNATDTDGNPAGGFASFGDGDAEKKRPPSRIEWQDGPVDRAAGELPNGVQVEDVLEVCRRRVGFFQDGKFSCIDNELAMHSIEHAIDSLKKRREDRRVRGVEGEHKE